MAKAPQSFWLKDILEVQRKAISEGYTDMIDSCTLMRFYGKPLSIVEGSYENIKITTPDDFYMFRALYDARENQQLNQE
jgi:2-C-methyl-D-erythritol 4-phosphate cytidylyltransferase